MHHLLPTSMSPPSSPRISRSQTAALTTSFCHGPSSPLPGGCNFRQPPQGLPFQDPPLPLGHSKTKEEKEDHHGDDTFHPTVQPTTYLWLHLQTATPVVTWTGPPLTSPGVKSSSTAVGTDPPSPFYFVISRPYTIYCMLRSRLILWVDPHRFSLEALRAAARLRSKEDRRPGTSVSGNSTDPKVKVAHWTVGPSHRQD